MKKEQLEKKLQEVNAKIEILESMIEDKTKKLFEEKEEMKRLALFARYNPFPVLRIDRENKVCISNVASNCYFRNNTLRGVPWNELVPNVDLDRIRK